MIKIGSLFDLAEKRLIMEKNNGEIPLYTAEDIIEYAIDIRKFLDNNPKKIKNIIKIKDSIKKEIRLARRKISLRNARRKFYLKNHKKVGKNGK
jgi:hypothetical protein